MSKGHAIVTGFATLDYPVELAEPFAGTGTRRIRRRPAADWPRAGGAALYASRSLVQAGVDAVPVTWVGEDAAAEQYLAACRQHAVDPSGVARLDGGITPACFLIYQPDGDYGCLFDPGNAGAASFTRVQRELLRRADLVIIAVGPLPAGDELLSLIRPDATVAWIAKADTAACPAPLRARYLARADYVFCNAGERPLLEGAGRFRSGRSVIVETHGAVGLRVDAPGAQFTVPVERIDAPDTTGAGDTLAGAMMARLLADPADLRGAAAAGATAAASLLRARARPPDSNDRACHRPLQAE